MKIARYFMGIAIAVLAVLMIAALSVTCAPVASAISEEDIVSATASAPCNISTAADLVYLSQYVNSGNSVADKYFLLTADITGLDSDTFSPIGTSSNPFDGHFDGAGHAINVNLNRNTDYTGVFGYTANVATVSSLVVGGTVSGRNYVGSVVGSNNGTIAECINLATVQVGAADNYRCGGIAGENTGTITDCVNAGTVKVHTEGGGIVGKSYGAARITSCVNFGSLEIVGAMGMQIGGLVGNNDGTVNDSYNYAPVNVTGSRLGSLIGEASSIGGSGRVYNVTEGSSRKPVGEGPALPSTIRELSRLDLLAGGALFADDTLIAPAFEEGYGYLQCPEFITGTPYQNLFKSTLFATATGDGSSATPFVIGEKRHFMLFATNTSIYGYSGKNVVLDTDLDLGEVAPMATVPFKGTFNGRGNRITFEMTATYGGLFFEIGVGGTVTNLELDATVQASGGAGILANVSSGTISEITTYGQVSGRENVGGLVGTVAGGTISECINNAAVSGMRYVGGIAGLATLTGAGELINYGAVTAANGNVFAYFGGLFGQLNANFVTSIVNFGAVTASKADYVGGLIGRFEGATLNCSADFVPVIGRSYVGGLVGFAQHDTMAISDCMAVADVTGVSNVGGLNGNNGGTLTINTSYYSGRLCENTETGVGTVSPATFFPIAPTSSVGATAYYNSDLIQKSDSAARSALQLTEQIFGTGNSNWVYKPAGAPGCGYAYFPVLDMGELTEDEAVLALIKYEFFGGGDGSTTAPYEIATEQHLRNLSYLVNNGSVAAYACYGTANYTQTADITFARKFIGIGTDGFSGSYDGNYYTLNELEFVGVGAMFITLDGTAKVSRVAIESGESDRCGIAETVGPDAVIEKSYVMMTIHASYNAAGGVAVNNNGTVKESFFIGKAVGAGTVGGVVGNNNGTVTDCFSSAYLSGAIVGGIAGVNAGTITRCMVSGTVNGVSGATAVGGLAGVGDGGTYSDSYTIVVVSLNDQVPADNNKIAGALVGTSVTSIVFDRIKYNGNYTAVNTAYYANNSAVNGRSFSVSSAAMLDDLFVNEFDTTVTHGFEFLPVSEREDKDGDYAPFNKIFKQMNSRVAELAKQAVKIHAFGIDNVSDEEWGSESNPYLISDKAHLLALSNRTSKYDYAGRYFKLTEDVDMTGETAFSPIGRYVSQANALNRPFNGTFDGDGHTIQGLIISELPNYGYIALFAYGGSSFVLKNLILDSESEISFKTQGNYAASLVGFNAGTVTHCLSYATVSNAVNIGGIVAACVNGASVTHTVFAGSFEEGDNHYGLTSQSIDTVTIDTTNSWYLRIISGAGSYAHNAYGSMLYADRGGTVSVEYDSSEFKFLLTAESGYLGKIMTSTQNTVVFTEDGNGYDPMINGNVARGDSVNFYARFTLPVSVAFSGYDTAITNKATCGEGEYFVGQSIKLTFKTEYGYFIDSDAVYSEWGITVTNLIEDIVFNFVVPEPTGAEIEIKVPVTVRKFSEYATIECEGGEYTATAKNLTVNVLEEYEDKFAAFTSSIYYGTDRKKVDSILNAGTYRITIPIVFKGSNYFMGTAEHSVTVTPVEIAPKNTNAETNHWAAVASKLYDGDATAYDVVLAVRDADTDALYFTGLIDTDITIIANITWPNKNAGSNRSATISDFRIVGDKAANYTFRAGSRVTTSRATITKRTVVATITEFTCEYTGSKPTVKWVLSESISGTVTAKFSKPAGTYWNGKDFNVGTYNLILTCDDGNYILDTSTVQYYISPKPVNFIDYSESDTNLFFIKDTDQKAKLSGAYRTVNGGADKCSFDFFYGDDLTPVTAVKNAGKYTAVPKLPDGSNYYLTDEVEPLVFTVKRIEASQRLTIRISGNTLKVGERKQLTIGGMLTGDDAVYSLETDDPRAALGFVTEGRYYYAVVNRYAEGRIGFRLAAKDSTNYLDRYSDYLYVTIESGKLYVALTDASRSLTYGDEQNVLLMYSFYQDFRTKYTHVEGETLTDGTDEMVIPGFRPAYCPSDDTIRQAGDVYEASVYPGSSDAYEFVIVHERCSITIAPRLITVSVSRGAHNGKIYGEAQDPEIGYEVYDGMGNDINREILTELPNGIVLNLVGKLTREAGETAASYTITAGTINTENNPNYTFNYELDGKFVISKRPVSLIADQITKEYGCEDPALTFSLRDNSMGYAYGDGPQSLGIVLTREAGEEIADYRYSAKITTHDNYEIDLDYHTNRFVITRAVPQLNIAVIGDIYYGDSLNVLDLSGQATSNGKPVAGRFEWSDPTSTPPRAGEFDASIRFVPVDSDIYETVRTYYPITVEKRRIILGYTGSFDYYYNGQSQCDIEPYVINAVNGETVSLLYGPVGDSVAVGTHNFGIITDNSNYCFEDGSMVKALKFTIREAVITVKVAEAIITEGDDFTPEISYSGFAEGEDESVLTSLATVGDIPTVGGFYTMTPSGASAHNYIFVYYGATLIINRTSLVSDKVTLSGSIGAEAKLTVSVLPDGSVEQARIDKSLKYSLIKPNMQKIDTYYSLNFGSSMGGEYVYTVDINVKANDKLYLTMSDGSVVELTEYEKTDDGKISFSAGQVAGIAVYTDKGVGEKIVAFLPLVGVGILAFIVVGGAITIMVQLKKRGKRERQYLARYDH